MLHERSPADTTLLPALHSLRSSRLFASRLVFLALDSLHLALGGLFILVLLRVVLRRTRLAVFSLLLLNLPLTAWNWTPTAVVYALATAALLSVVVLRVGCLPASPCSPPNGCSRRCPLLSISVRGTSRHPTWSSCSSSVWPS